MGQSHGGPRFLPLPPSATLQYYVKCPCGMPGVDAIGQTFSESLEDPKGALAARRSCRHHGRFLLVLS